MTAARPNSLRVELEDWDGVRAYANYGKFKVGDEKQTQYRLEAGSYSGTGGDSLSSHSNMGFTTKDRDNDAMSGSNCAVSLTGGWWYRSCFVSNLNGRYGKYKIHGTGVSWYYFKHNYNSLKFAEMKLRSSS